MRVQRLPGQSEIKKNKKVFLQFVVYVIYMCFSFCLCYLDVDSVDSALVFET